jgi:hypothetical protein
MEHCVQIDGKNQQMLGHTNIQIQQIYIEQCLMDNFGYTTVTSTSSPNATVCRSV